MKDISHCLILLMLHVILYATTIDPVTVITTGTDTQIILSLLTLSLFFTALVAVGVSYVKITQRDNFQIKTYFMVMNLIVIVFSTTSLITHYIIYF